MRTDRVSGLGCGRGEEKKNTYITACTVVQCSVKDDFSSEGKTPYFDYLPDPTPWSDQNQTWQN
jgi:hypothetical protein